MVVGAFRKWLTCQPIVIESSMENVLVVTSPRRLHARSTVIYLAKIRYWVHQQLCLNTVQILLYDGRRSGMERCDVLFEVVHQCP